jgi:hypothetical protein
MRRKAVVVLVLLVAVVLAERREFLFINLNYQIDHVQRGTEFSYAHSKFQQATAGRSLDELTALKWCASAAYVAVMTLLAVVLARSLFGDHRYARPILIGVAAAALAALSLFLLAHWVASLADVAVKLLHMLQYPVILLVLLAARSLGRGTGPG